MASPRPASPQPNNKERRPSSQVHGESPLRKMSFPVDEVPAIQKVGHAHDHAVESEAEHEDDVIHIEPPYRTTSRIDGGGYDPPTEDLGPHGGNTEEEGGFLVENGYGAPILASDEIQHRPEAQFMQPAIEPEQERLGSTYLDLDSTTPPTYQSGRRSSRPGSRSNSIHTLPHMSRYTTIEDRPESGTPLEDVKEYEPLFPEEEGLDVGKQKSASEPNLPLGNKPKRLDLARHHFPSQDVWEDAPNSLMYETTVKTPQVPEFSIPAAEHEPKEIFETSEQEKARKVTIKQSDKQNFVPVSTKKLAKSDIKPDFLQDQPERPILPARHKFPSRDVWEDTAPSLLHTTIITPQPEKQEPLESKYTSPEGTKAVSIIPVRPSRAKPAMGGSSTSPEDKRAPGIPDRPKPKVPERPSKPLQRGSSEEVPLAKSTSAEEKETPTFAKVKPVVPARPAGSKIAALQAGFMKDLNQRLQLGPQVPKKEEPPKEEVEEEKEKAPLADARKGRARGPQRRRPGVSPSAAAGEEKPKAVRFEISKMVTVFEIDEDGAVKVATAETAKEAQALAKSVEPVAEKTEEIPSVKDETPADIELMAKDESKTAEKVSGEETVASTAEPATSADLSGSTEIVKLLEKVISRSSDATVQTGETKITLPKKDGETEELTAYLGGRADKPGTVIEKDGEQHVGEADTLGKIERTGTGI